jgi:hypothetical protein
MFRIFTLLNILRDIANVLYTFSFLMLQFVSVGVMIVIFFDRLCIEGVITTDRTYVLMESTAVVIVSVALVFCNEVTNALFDVKMATALRIAMKVDSITTAQQAADHVNHWREECSFARSEYLTLSGKYRGLESQIAKLREKNQTLQSENAQLQQENATFQFLLNDSRYMIAAPAPADAAAGVQV